MGYWIEHQYLPMRERERRREEGNGIEADRKHKGNGQEIQLAVLETARTVTYTTSDMAVILVLSHSNPHLRIAETPGPIPIGPAKNSAT
jgi:hypothetical protein